MPAQLSRLALIVLVALVAWRCMTLNVGTPLGLLARHAALALLLPAAWAGLLGARDRQQFERARSCSWLASLPLAASTRLSVALLRSLLTIAACGMLTVLVLWLANRIAGEPVTSGERSVLATLAAGFALGAAVGWLCGSRLAKRRPHRRRLRFAGKPLPDVAPTASLDGLGRWPGLELRARGNAPGMAKTIGVILLIQPAGIPPPMALVALGGGVVAFLLVDAWRGIGMTVAAARGWLAPTPLSNARLARALLPRALTWQLLGSVAIVGLLAAAGASMAVSVSAGLVWLCLWCASAVYACVRALPSGVDRHG